jgi:hypothetical protein
MASGQLGLDDIRPEFFRTKPAFDQVLGMLEQTVTGSTTQGVTFSMKATNLIGKVVYGSLRTNMEVRQPKTYPPHTGVAEFLRARVELTEHQVDECVTFADQVELLRSCEGWHQRYQNGMKDMMMLTSLSQVCQMITFGVPAEKVREQPQPRVHLFACEAGVHGGSIYRRRWLKAVPVVAVSIDVGRGDGERLCQVSSARNGVGCRHGETRRRRGKADEFWRYHSSEVQAEFSTSVRFHDDRRGRDCGRCHGWHRRDGFVEGYFEAEKAAGARSAYSRRGFVCASIAGSRLGCAFYTGARKRWLWWCGARACGPGRVRLAGQFPAECGRLNGYMVACLDGCLSAVDAKRRVTTHKNDTAVLPLATHARHWNPHHAQPRHRPTRTPGCFQPRARPANRTWTRRRRILATRAAPTRPARLPRGSLLDRRS